jgi:hypothetical protein
VGYTTRTGRRPNEYASKSAHAYVIKDPTVQAFLAGCETPKKAECVDLSKQEHLLADKYASNPIKHVIAIDGGYSEVIVRPEFPSATICFFQFGALIFGMDDLESLEQSPFIDPEDMGKLKRIQRIKLTLPVKNVSLKGSETLTNSIRLAVYNFFKQEVDDGQLLETLRWFMFEEYDQATDVWTLASCPSCRTLDIPLSRKSMSVDGQFVCSACAAPIYLTDVFRLHEAVDDELGAGGILGYVTTTLEQLILVHLIRLVLKTKPSLLNDILFIKDGPLAFFGQTANLHKPMRHLVGFLFREHNLFLAGLEKSGAFVEHAHEIASLLEAGQVLILDNDYIYRYVIPGKADPANPYGQTTYYGNKLIFKAHSGSLHVMTLPMEKVISHAKSSDFQNLGVVLLNVAKLKCDMYDDSLVPVALVNKLVSLANHPSARILQKFAKKTMANGSS